MVSIPEVALGLNDQKIPVIGFGTSDFPYGSYERVKEAVLNAIEVGYRHFDTASVYQSEKPLGDAISEALKRGLIKSRSELFITSKLFGSDAYSHLVLPALQESLKNLELEYLDLYVIHFPMSLKPGKVFPFKPEDIVSMDFESVWKAMEECQILGLTKSIGVCSFTYKKIERLLATARILPAVNIVEMNPLWQQKMLRKFCKEKGIHIIACSALGGKGTPWGTKEVLACEALKDIASAKGKTVAQVCLRWVYEQGASVVVKSFNEERMKENVEIFEWKLNEEELQKIDQIPEMRRIPTEALCDYKSLLEDGEL